MSDPQPEPQAEPALVLERWNSWVKLYFPASGGTGWVNLGDREWERLEPAAAPAPRPD
jgi:hypothetical protein